MARGQTVDLEQRELALDSLDMAGGENSWVNMQETHPLIADRIEQAVAAGASPERIYSRLLANHGMEFCKWCRTVARYLKGTMDT